MSSNQNIKKKLEVKDLNFSFAQNSILENFTFNIYDGEFVGILGPNGCGKSTLLKNILQIYKPNSGIIKLENKALKDYSLKERSKIIGFVPQKSAIAMPLRVEEIILMGRFSHMKNVFQGYSKEDRQAVEDIMQRLGLIEFKKRDIFSLSGGEFQRVMLARALVSNPSLLLLDEPTSALDLNFSVSILKLCKNLIKESFLKGVIVIHDLNLASLVCDRILLISDKKIAYQGTPKELFTKEILKEIYDLDCEILYYENRPVIILN